MGPFKHEVDDGLDLRKAAFECMYTLLDTCVDRLDIFEFLCHVQDGLKDHYEMKMLTYLMVSRVAQLCPGAVLTKLDKLVEPLKLTVTTKVCIGIRCVEIRFTLNLRLGTFPIYTSYSSTYLCSHS